MSKGTVGQIIQKAIGDAAFRRQLQSDPKKALAGFDLTADERSAITSGDPGRLTALGVDQRMSKAFMLGGISAASKSAVSPDLSGASASAFIDEDGAGGRTTSAIEPGGASANTANLRRIEGDLNVSAARGAEDASGNTANLRRIEGDLNVSAAREAEDVSGDFTAFDPGIASNATSAVREAAQSGNATNLRRVEGDLNVANAATGETSALNTGASAYEGGATSNVAAARQPVDVSGDFNKFDPGTVTKTSEATAFEPGRADLDLGMIDPGQVSGETGTRVAGTEQGAESAHSPGSTTDAAGNRIPE